MITAGGFARFYTPLAATSLLLTATNPILAAALARSPDPVTALAGYSVAFAVCGVLYAPLLVVQQVAAARLLAAGSFSPVKRFAYLSGAVFSLIGALIAYTGAGDVVFARLVGVGPEVLAEAVRAMQFLWPVPFLTAVRAAHQGRLVAGHRTLPIAVATGGRTGILAVVAFSLLATGGGAWLGAAAFTAGLVLEMLWVMWSPTPDIQLEQADCEADKENVARFSAPLMLNVLLWWATPLIINAVLARTADPESGAGRVRGRRGGGVVHRGTGGAAPARQHRTGRVLRNPPPRAGVGRDRGLLDDGAAPPAVPARHPRADPPFRLRPRTRSGRARRGRSPHRGRVSSAIRAAAVLPGALRPLRPHRRGRFRRGAARGEHRHCGLLRAGSGADRAVLGVGLAVLGLTIEGLFLERYAQRDVMPELRASRAAAINPEAFEGVA